MKISRRNFIRMVSLSSLSLASFPMVNFGCTRPGKQSQQNGALYEIFQNPPNSSKPYVRWWWNGNRLTKEEILRELDLLKDAGIGGVEINPIKFPGGETLGIESLTWLSDEWIEMVQTAVQGAHERDMECDIIVGSGWPFGGEFLEKNEQTRILALGTRKLEGPGTVTLSRQELLDEVELEIHSKHKPVYKQLHSVRLVSPYMEEFDPGKDLTDQFTNEELQLDLPSGEHVLYFMVLQTGYQAVINGAPGASGPVLNHYDRSAVKKFLTRMSDTLNPRLNGLDSAFRSMFCDSLELEGANWCEDMLEEFKRRRGYSLEPYLPFVLFKIGHMGNRVTDEYGSRLEGSALEEVKRARYDFYITRQELFKERFIKTYQQWCETNNVKSRVQAYGRGYHPLESSMNIDIPECETWLRGNIGTEQGRAYTTVNKFVASGSRLAGKQLVSCEEITNTTVVFFSTLEMIKIAGDQSNLSGVNHSILHGFNYSPKEARFPGWVRYGTFFNERNPWWPFMKYWTDYKARLSAVFQNAEARADVAIMHPLADLWMEYGLQRLPFPRDEHPWYQFDLWEAVHQNGNTCDYISEKILNEGKIEKGALRYNGRTYHTIMLMEVASIQPGTAKAMARFAEAGGRLIFIGSAPYKSTGLKNYRENDSTVKKTIERIKDEYPESCKVVNAPEDDLITWFRDVQKQFEITPDVVIDPLNRNISQVQYTHGEEELFFFTNSNINQQLSFRATFNTGEKVPWIWDPETGERYLYPFDGQKNKLTIELAPSESKLIVFDNNEDGQPMPVKRPDSASALDLGGPWEVSLHHVDGTRRQKTLEKLVDFKEDPELKTFAGTAIYTNTINLDSRDSYAYLNLGEVNGISEVSVNGNKLGFKWYGKHLYELKDSLKEGSNTIEIKITTVLGNYCKSLENNSIAQRWTQRQSYASVGLIGPVKLMKKS
ncbi:MAG: glycosyl hydrolase [Bacteroidales bacterium]